MRKFIISGDFQCRSVGGNLEIDNFDHLVMEWVEELSLGSGRVDGKTDTQYLNKTYDEGRILFVPLFKHDYIPPSYDEWITIVGL